MPQSNPMTPRVETLLPPQREFWDKLAARVPRRFVLYGGTAVALRLGHRRSVEFYFFSSRPLDRDALYRAIPGLTDAQQYRNTPDTLTVALPIAGDEVKVSFFGDIGFGRVGDPDRIPDRPPIASALDLLGTKLALVQKRIQPKDYLDIEALLRSGLSLNEGIAAGRALYGERLNPIDTAKTISWFKEGDLETELPAETRAFLENAATSVEPGVDALPLKSRDLHPEPPRRFREAPALER